jgi:23S rRNA (cytosine1962-C5)-methyltransferase
MTTSGLLPPFTMKLPDLPRPSGVRLPIRLYPRAERAVRRGHPWVFAQGIRQQRREGSAGDLAVIFDRGNRFLAVGLYDPSSPLRIRILQHGEPANIDGEWFAARVRAAYALRLPLLEQGTTGYRIIHGENDRLPGMVVDRYGSSVVVKLYSAACIPYLCQVLESLLEVLHTDRIVLRLSRALQKAPQELHGLADGQLLLGVPMTTPVHFQENGLTFEADLIRGQKTGFFLDQRDNRARVERLAANRSVLNVFAYTGGFSIYAARGGARLVASLELSALALAAAERNFEHNRHLATVAAARHRPLRGDAFELLQRIARTGDRYDLVILDPPSFAKARGEVERALQSYRRLASLGLGALRSGGTLVAASCSSRVGADEFAEAVGAAAREAGRPLRIFERTGHPLDHPIAFPEAAYLKCVYATA